MISYHPRNSLICFERLGTYIGMMWADGRRNTKGPKTVSKILDLGFELQIVVSLQQPTIREVEGHYRVGL